MKVSRVGFLKICSAALLGRHVDACSWLAVADGPAATANADPPPGRFHVQHASAACFRPHVNTTFAISPTEEDRVRLVLARVIETPIDASVEQFSLIFHAPASSVVPDGIYPFQHPMLGRFDLFIAPIGGPNVQHTAYEACFSRHVSRSEDKACQISS